MNSPAAKTAIALLFIGVLVTWAAWPKHLPPPDEKNRASHPTDGYSIIAPPNWTKVIETEAATVAKENRGWLKIEPATKGYYPPSMMVLVLANEPDVEKLKIKDKFVDGSFQGKPALIRSAPQKKYWAYEVIFKDHDRWFHINLSTPDYNDVPTSSWWPYVNSFRYEPEKAARPFPATATTIPTTVPKFTIDTGKGGAAR